MNYRRVACGPSQNGQQTSLLANAVAAGHREQNAIGLMVQSGPVARQTARHSDAKSHGFLGPFPHCTSNAFGVRSYFRDQFYANKTHKFLGLSSCTPQVVVHVSRKARKAVSLSKEAVPDLPRHLTTHQQLRTLAITVTLKETLLSSMAKDGPSCSSQQFQLRHVGMEGLYSLQPSIQVTLKPRRSLGPSLARSFVLCRCDEFRDRIAQRSRYLAAANQNHVLDLDVITESGRMQGVRALCPYP
ncbi:hypothetical protein P153DRAFT_185204 [Dothidotthia symphoricarpi CBS 119687]|uniref:Uncharacterized protein n=1 Tax=Dothidotthia symphoricarpi CBS 119687 TaxID=1392245 RepID=A0A6A6AMJ7_9PLEO|nr:uncharacterized protein P153DRAFT_185204 [Dothidotthia symphoricarpi CBS 119687]KAF2132154.1 hypothetical protein P153DRAFT_185204 [Dothidotthia symphoricarpi CBS 119687]